MNTSLFSGAGGSCSMEGFLDIIRKLRSPEGCIWDRQQTHESIRREFLEECYEAVEAIDAGDPAMLREELGDVLLQVVFHSIIEEEKGNFTFEDVVAEVARKMVVRHPHVFGNVRVDSVEELLTNWDAIKKETKGQKSDREALESISKAMPALMRNQKVQKKAAKLGVAAAESPAKELAGLAKGEITRDSVGRMLELTVALAQGAGVDAEEALSRRTEAFLQEEFPE